MAYNRKPNYHFADSTSTGIDKVPVGRVVVVENIGGETVVYIKQIAGSLNASSTIQNAIDAGVIVVNGGGATGAGVDVVDNTTTNSTFYPLFVDVTTGAPGATSVSSSKLQFNPSSGNFSSVTFTSLSDINYKEDIITAPSDIVKNLRGVEFTWKDSGLKSSGVIAQEVEAVIPHVIETSAEGVKTVNYMALTAYLIETIKDLTVRLEKLEA